MGRKRGKISLCHTHLAIFPPVLVLEFGSAALELRGSGLQGVGAVVQLRQLLISLQDFVHIHTHDVHHLRDENTHQHLWYVFHLLVVSCSPHLVHLCLCLLESSVARQVWGLS